MDADGISADQSVGLKKVLDHRCAVADAVTNHEGPQVYAADFVYGGPVEGHAVPRGRHPFAIEIDLKVVLQRMSRFHPRWGEVFDYEEVSGGRHAGVYFFLQLAAKGFLYRFAHFDGAAMKLKTPLATAVLRATSVRFWAVEDDDAH